MDNTIITLLTIDPNLSPRMMEAVIPTSNISMRDPNKSLTNVMFPAGTDVQGLDNFLCGRVHPTVFVGTLEMVYYFGLIRNIPANLANALKSALALKHGTDVISKTGCKDCDDEVVRRLQAELKRNVQ